VSFLPSLRSAADERAHNDAVVEEWTFSCWEPSGAAGLIAGLRLVGRSNAWYWWAFARDGEPVLHVVETSIPRRSDPLLCKAQAMWAEFTCEQPFEQWTVGNETYAAALDDPADGFGRAYGEAVPIASDIEWYATSEPTPFDDGYRQSGVAHGTVDLLAGRVEFDDWPAERTHRWGASAAAWRPDAAFAHLGLWVGFRFPDDSRLSLALTPTGWRSRAQ
jgi:hypothetical protein